jgi:hypothetical protein
MSIKDIKYCGTVCEKGKKASESCLNENNSAFDAALDFRLFVEECKKTCTKCSSASSNEVL